jgi:class 3 adenylate cyclase/tetratricopeptide (TPR) repeat protein
VDNAEVERKQLEEAIAALEEQRATLGDAVVDAAQASMREKLATLQEPAGEPEPAAPGERRIVTVLFCDVTGSTAMAEQMDPEAWTAIMNQAYPRLIEPVYRYGGIVSRLLGDAILAFFGAPLAHEDDPLRACRAALDILEEARHFAGRLESEQGVAGFGVRVGINTGLAIVGQVGSELKDEYTAMGDTVNLASRLETAAAPGTALIGPETHSQVAHAVETESIGPIRVKGKAEPIPAFRLLRLKSRAERLEGPETAGIASPLVGREAELQLLEASVEQLLEGVGGVAFVVGEAGLGKSRLLAELRASVESDQSRVESHQQPAASDRQPATDDQSPTPNSQPPTPIDHSQFSAERSSAVQNSKLNAAQPLAWLEGSTLSYGRNISYWPFQEIMWGFAGISEDDDETEAWEKLEKGVRRYFGDVSPEILPYLASLISLDPPDAYVQQSGALDGEAMRRQVFFAARRFFRRLAAEKPVILAFEDLHWADESSALLIEHLLPLTENERLLIIGLGRPDPGNPAARLRELAADEFADRYTEVQLQALSEDDSAILLQNLLDIDNLPVRLRRPITRKADGNPFFMEEIIRTLASTGAVVRNPATGRLEATADVETIAIPDTLQGVITARIDRLEDGPKRVLRAASVIGRSFFYRLLAAVAADDGALDGHLAVLQQVEFIQLKQATPEMEYTFKHALAQEVTYEGILLERRRELHARVAEAIEAMFGDRLDEFYGLLAYHFARAEEWEKAQEFLFKAGDQASGLAADAEALAHYRQALAAYDHAFGDKWDPVQRAVLERKMAVALVHRGEHEQALAALYRALSHLDRPLPASTWGVRLAIVKELLQQLTHRLLPGSLPPHMDVAPSPGMEEEFHTYEAFTWIDGFINPERYLLVTLRGLNWAEGQGYALAIGGFSAAVGLVTTIYPLRGLPEGYYRRAQEIGERIQADDVIGWVKFASAWYEAFQGNWEKTRALSRQAAKKFQNAGYIGLYRAFPRFEMATALTYQGNYSEALEHCHDLIDFGRDGDAPQELCWGLSALGLVQRHLGRLDEAIAASSEAAELAEAIPDLTFHISTRADVGRSYLRQGRLEEALAALEASEEIFEDHLGPDSYASLRNGLAEAHLIAAETDFQGEGARRLKEASRSCGAALKLGKQFRPALPEAMRMRGTYEWLRGKPAAAHKWWEESLALAKELGQPYDNARTLLEMGTRNQNVEQLERAAEIFADIGAKLDLAQTKERPGQP